MRSFFRLPGRSCHSRRSSGDIFAAIVCIAVLGAGAVSGRAARVYRDHVDPHWLVQGTRFWYRVESGPDEHEFVVVDATRGTRLPAFDHAKLAKALAERTGRPVDARRLPIDWLDFDAEPGALRFFGSGKAWRLDLKTEALSESTAAASELPSLPAGQQPHPSRGGAAETRLTFVNRTAGAVTVEWIDPDGQRHAYLTLKPGESSEQQTYAGHVWVVSEESGRILGVFEAAPGPGRAVVGGPSSARSVTAAAGPLRLHTAPGPQTEQANAAGPESPDHHWVALIRDDNLFIRDLRSGEVFPLSHDGKKDDGYSLDRVWWSPDSSHLAAIRLESGQEHKIFEVESSPKNQLQPKLRTLDYRKPGDRIEHPRPQLFHVATRRQMAVDDSLFATPWSIDDVRWFQDSSRFTFTFNQRGQQALRVIAVDAGTLKGTFLFRNPKGDIPIYGREP